MLACADFTKNFKRKAFIGQGGFGHVWTFRFKETSAVFAQKAFLRDYNYKELLAEVKVLSLGGCEYIPSMLYAGLNQQYQWCIIMELIDGGTLQHHIDTNSQISPEGKQTIAYQLALAVDYLHDQYLVHG